MPEPSTHPSAHNSTHLAIAREDLESLVLLNQDMLCVAGLDGYLKWLSPKWSQRLGWSDMELLNRPFIEFVHPEDRAATLTNLERLAAGDAAVSFENRHQTRQGEWRWLAWDITSRVDGTLFAAARDVTETHLERRRAQAKTEQVRQLERLSRVGTWRLDLLTRDLHWSPEVYSIHGRRADEFTPTMNAALDGCLPEDRAIAKSHIEEAIKTQQPFSITLRIVRASDGEVRSVYCSGAVQKDEDGNPIELIGVFQDVTHITAAEKKLRGVNASLQRRMKDLERRSHLTASTSELVDMLQAALDIEEAREVIDALLPQVFRKLSGVLYLVDPDTGIYSQATHFGSRDASWKHAEPHNCWALRRGTEHHVAPHGRLRCRHLHDVNMTSRCIPLMAQGQTVGLLVVAATNNDEEKRLGALSTAIKTVADQIAMAIANVRLRDRLQQQSLRDQLTGLYNRRFFDDWLSKQLSQSKRTGSPLGLALLDLDHFKRFNDTHGHMCADRLLVAFSTMVRSTIRDGDVVCRWGGEEFLMAMPNANAHEVARTLKRVQERLAQLEIRDDTGVRVSPTTLSAGIVCSPTHGDNPDELLFTADAALYEAKHQGRDRCIVANQDDNDFFDLNAIAAHIG